MTARLTEIQNLGELARAVGHSAGRIKAYAEAIDQESAYSKLIIPKRGRKRRGQYRVVYQANEIWLAQFHRMIAIMVVESAPFQQHVQGFVQGRSIRSNAQIHLGAAKILHADITNFFDSITVAQVETSLLTIGVNKRIAEVISRGCTIDGLLRQGTRCSPALANLVCRHLDQDFLVLAQKHGARYTRYADDITFSGDAIPDAEGVAEILNQNGFTLRDGRCYTQYKGRSQFVTGLYVGDSERPRLPRQLKRRLRLVLHFVEKFGTDEHFERTTGRVSELEGMLRFVHSIEPELAKRLFAQLAIGYSKNEAPSDEEMKLDFLNDRFS